MKSHKSSNRDNNQHRDSNQNQNDSVQFKTKTNTEFDSPFGQSIDFQQAADNNHDATVQKKTIQKVAPMGPLTEEDAHQKYLDENPASGPMSAF